MAAGGATRQESSRIAVESAPSDAEIVLIHDGARPFVSGRVISDVIQAVRRSGAAAAGIPVADTIKKSLPKGLRRSTGAASSPCRLPRALASTSFGALTLRRSPEYTDEMALLETAGVRPEVVAGDPQNFKITTLGDLARARALARRRRGAHGPGIRHPSLLGRSGAGVGPRGVAFPGHRGLEGHSDADVLLHAATDALLGAAALGDIGVHFPNTEERWRGEPSLTFLRHAATLLTEAGWRIVNLDLALVAESPKVMPYAALIRQTIADALAVESSRVSLKATTNERLGAVGRGEGIAAFATATVAERSLGYSPVRARAPTSAAPASRSARAQARAVLPVVSTSSMSSTDFPATVRSARKALWRFDCRSVWLRPTWGRVARTRRRQRLSSWKVPAQQLRLVESAQAAAAPVDRHRKDYIGLKP